MTVKNGSSARISLLGDARPNDTTSGSVVLSPGFLGTCSWLPFLLCLTFYLHPSPIRFFCFLSSLATLVPPRGSGKQQQAQVGSSWSCESLLKLPWQPKYDITGLKCYQYCTVDNLHPWLSFKHPVNMQSDMDKHSNNLMEMQISQTSMEHQGLASLWKMGKCPHPHLRAHTSCGFTEHFP